MTLTNLLEKIRRDHDENRKVVEYYTKPEWTHHEQLLKALEIAIKALPCDEGMEASGEQCGYCFAKDEIEAVLKGCGE
jgi:hypothetical protein